MPYVRRSFEEIETRFGGTVKLLRKDLGLSAFGVQVFDYPPGGSGPEHDEASSGQEELHVGLSGSGWIEVDGERVDIGPRVAVVIPPGTTRRTVAGPDGLSMLAVGGTPGRAYEVFPKFA